MCHRDVKVQKDIPGVHRVEVTPQGAYRNRLCQED